MLYLLAGSFFTTFLGCFFLGCSDEQSFVDDNAKLHNLQKP